MQVTIIIAPRYVVRKGLTGNGSRSFSDCFEDERRAPGADPFERTIEGLLLLGEGRGSESTDMSIAGDISNRFRRTGIDEYIVVAKRIERTLRRKSVSRATERYGVKKDRRDCKADHKRTAACVSMSISHGFRFNGERDEPVPRGSRN
jgi:hypothetical protein